MSLPVQSADLNTIELVWDELDWKIRAKWPHLWQLLQECWAELSVEVFNMMSLPVQSADLNPIELVWDELDWKIRAKWPHLWQLLQECWAELSVEVFLCQISLVSKCWVWEIWVSTQLRNKWSYYLKWASKLWRRDFMVNGAF